MSADQLLKHLKRLLHSTSPCPLDPRHPDHSQNWHLWLCLTTVLLITTSTVNCTHCIPLQTFLALELNYDVHDKELLAIFWSLQMMVTLSWRLCNSRSTWSINHQNLKYFAMTKILMHQQAWWSEYLLDFNLVIWFRPGKFGTKPDALTRQWDIYLKEGIVTMPVSTHRTFIHVYNQTTGIIPRSSHPSNPSPSRISIMDAKRLHTDIQTQLQEDPISTNTSAFSQTQLDPWPWWSTSPLWSDLCPEHQEPLDSPWQDISVRQRHSTKSSNTTTGQDSCLCQGLLQIVYYLSMPPVHHKPMDFSSNFQSLRALEFISMDFIENSTPHSGYTSILSHCWSSFKAVVFILTHNTITSPQLVQLFILHVTSDCGTDLSPTSLLNWDSTWHDLHSLRDTTLKEMDRQNKQIRLWSSTSSLLQLQQDNWSDSYHLAKFTYNNTQPPLALHPSLPTRVITKYHCHPEHDLASSHVQVFITDLNELHQQLQLYIAEAQCWY